MDKENCNHSNEIISLFSQYFYDYFNCINNKNKIFWHAKCFSINENKIISYLKFRSKIIKNVMTTYFLIQKKSYFSQEKLSQRSERCSQFPDYEILSNIQDGILYYDGAKIDLNEFYNGNIKVIEDTNSIENIEILDLLDF